MKEGSCGQYTTATAVATGLLGFDPIEKPEKHALTCKVRLLKFQFSQPLTSRFQGRELLVG